jgi:hypothetical protein
VLRGDSDGRAKIKIDKTFVIQNLFTQPRKSGMPPEIFLNYSLDSKLSPKRRRALAEPVDNHPQVFENKWKIMSAPAPALSGGSPCAVKKPRICRQSNQTVKKSTGNVSGTLLPSHCPANKKPGAERRVGQNREPAKTAQAESDFTRCASRETFREAVLE